MAIVRKTVYQLDNRDTFDTLEQALGNLRLLKLQAMFVSLFPDQKNMVGAWAKVFAERNAEIITALQNIETELADAAKDYEVK